MTDGECWIAMDISQGKSYRIFSVGGELEPYMLALELRNGRKLGVIASKHTVMLLRPKE